MLTATATDGPEADLDELGEQFCIKPARSLRAPEFFLGVVNSVAGKSGPSSGTIVEGLAADFFRGRKQPW